ncbi:hypothetical protein PXQ59_002169 [Vibrio parahaemolyticus]|nr:hypothetical protein [Vibrio parahaemolyticus]
MESLELSTVRVYKNLFLEVYHVIPSGIAVNDITSCDNNNERKPFNDFEFDFKGLNENSELLNDVIKRCNDKFAALLKKADNRDMRLQLESHSIEIKNLLIKALFEEEKLQSTKLSFSLLDGNVEDPKSLTELERHDLHKIAKRIQRKPHLIPLYKKCEEVVEHFMDYKHKVKKRKRKMPKLK